MYRTETTPAVYSVSAITRLIKKTIEGRADFAGIWVRGEVYNLTFHPSGHIYFTLKDDQAVLAAVFFKSANRGLSFRLREGMTVLARGSITVYEKRGNYQINVSELKEEGIGDLQRRIEQLKHRLLAEGLFDPAKKRPLPLLPRRIGVATSPTGAAVRDIIKVALRRYPGIGIVIAPAVVQGDGAAESIAAAIRELNRPEHRVDVIIAGRGGGSFEDLLPFSEEIVVRAFAASRVPIVSAVGHQIDHPLCDDAADLAAPTPSAAAELAVPDRLQLAGEIDYLEARIVRAAAVLTASLRKRVDAAASRRVLREPLDFINRKALMLADAESRLVAALRSKVANARQKLLSVPDLRLVVRGLIQKKTHAFSLAVRAIEQLSPLAVLSRGYAIPTDERGRLVRSVRDVGVGDLLRLIMRDGTLDCGVTSVHPGGINGKEESA